MPRNIDLGPNPTAPDSAPSTEEKGSILDKLGFTAIGKLIAAIVSPSAIRFFRVNANNTVDLISDADMRIAIGAMASNATPTPAAHKTSHATGGADALTAGDISAATIAQGILADSADQTVVVSTNAQTAVSGKNYLVTFNGTVDFTEPQAAAGAYYFITLARSGCAVKFAGVTAGGLSGPGQRMVRYYNGTNWQLAASYQFKVSSFTAQVGVDYLVLPGSDTTITYPTPLNGTDTFTVTVLSGGSASYKVQLVNVAGKILMPSAVPYVFYSFYSGSWQWGVLPHPLYFSMYDGGNISNSATYTPQVANGRSQKIACTGAAATLAAPSMFYIPDGAEIMVRVYSYSSGTSLTLSGFASGGIYPTLPSSPITLGSGKYWEFEMRYSETRNAWILRAAFGGH